MPSLPFSKVQGLGNDFVVVDLRPGSQATAQSARVQDPATVRALCDRNFGVGADGVLAILQGDQGVARMRVLNADGSEAEMCGNGIRCVAKVLHDQNPEMRKPQLGIDTGAGLLQCALETRNGSVESVSVDMGKPRLSRSEIPMAGPPGETVVREPLKTDGVTFGVTAVSMGNPHAVIFVEESSADLMALARRYGPKLETHPAFPQRTNVEFARVRPGAKPEIDLVVWERGVGITLACGTGACATAVAAYLESRAPGGSEIAVNLPGGTLNILVNAHQPDPDMTASLSPRGVRMRGPAKTVFESNIDIDQLLQSVASKS